AYGPQNDVTLKMPAFEWVHVQLHQQKGMISLSPPTICNSARHLQSDGPANLKESSEDQVYPGHRDLRSWALTPELSRLA
ncbi:hypothetical protein, partial [Escherichia coli]|uniref:hypothetical protein n=1 Tax=Escherichia coli TaxID=562 RepID=UPI001EFB5C80